MAPSASMAAEITTKVTIIMAITSPTTIDIIKIVAAIVTNSSMIRSIINTESIGAMVEVHRPTIIAVADTTIGSNIQAAVPQANLTT